MEFNDLSRASSFRISISKLSFLLSRPSWVSFLFWNYSESTGFINECPTQILSVFQSFKEYISEDVQKGLLFMSHLIRMKIPIISNESGISKIYNDHMSLSIHLVFNCYFSFLVNICLCIRGFVFFA